MQTNTLTTVNTSAAANAVARNTYFLLALTLMFSALMATYALVTQAAPMNIVLLLAGFIGLPMLTARLSKSAWGLLGIFLFTGFTGYSIGPILNMYIHGFTNGSAMVGTALGATSVIFMGLTLYAWVSKENFSYLGGFIAIASIAAFVASLAGFFFQIPLLQLVVSGVFAVVSAGYILYTTSAIIHGGENNYILATMTLYIAVFNLFMSLLRILSFFSGNRSS